MDCLDSASLTHLSNVTGAVAQLSQDRPRVFTHGRQAAGRLGDAFDIERRAEDINGAFAARDGDVEETVALEHLGMGEDVGDVVKAAVGDRCGLKP